MRKLQRENFKKKCFFRFPASPLTVLFEAFVQRMLEVFMIIF